MFFFFRLVKDVNLLFNEEAEVATNFLNERLSHGEFATSFDWQELLVF